MDKAKEYGVNLLMMAVVALLFLGIANAALGQIDRQVCSSASAVQYVTLGCEEVR